jgi:hypothetical protein
MEFKALVQNVPKEHCRYIVVRCVANELWYWGSWDDEEAAKRVASEFENGLVLEQIAM